AGAYCPATCLAAAHPAAEHRDRAGDLEDGVSAGQPAARKTGCSRRAGYARRAWAHWARGRASDRATEPGGSARVPQAARGAPAGRGAAGGRLAAGGAAAAAGGVVVVAAGGAAAGSAGLGAGAFSGAAFGA